MNKVFAKKGFVPTHKNLCVGFTLIELLIVIGILAILATVVLLVLNPAQMFAQARDSQRISDLNSLKSAIATYLTTESTNASLDNGATVAGGNCGANFWGTEATTSTSLIGTAGTRTFHGAQTATTSINGTGWVPVDLSIMSGGSPISSLPLDPSGVNSASQSNNGAYAYYYGCSTTQKTFKLVAKMESDRYKNGSLTDDKESTDGGIVSWLYEVGTNIGATL